MLTPPPVRHTLPPVQSPDVKKEEFRRYLERSGVIDALTKGARQTAPVTPASASAHSSLEGTGRSRAATRARAAAVLVGLYEEPEKPMNALDFVKMTLGAPTGVDVEALKAENDQLREKNDQMTQKIAELTKKASSLLALLLLAS